MEENLAWAEILIPVGLARMEGGGGERASKDVVSSEGEQHCLTVNFPFHMDPLDSSNVLFGVPAARCVQRALKGVL